MEERFKFRHVHAITGTFVLVVVGLLVAAVVWTGRSQRWFKGNVTLGIIMPESGAAGIRQGSGVYFLGTLVGTVFDVELDDRGRMQAQANIRRDFFRFLRADSFAVVKKKFGVAGDSYFEITRGEGQPLPERNATITCNEEFQNAIESAVEEVRRELIVILKKLNGGLDVWTRLGADLQLTQQHLDRLAIHLENMAAGVQTGRGTVGQWITNTNLADETQKLVARANEAMGELHAVATNLNVAVKNIQNSTVRLPEITDAVANETKDLQGFVQQTQATMRELERLIEAMQRHWLVRRYVNKTNPPPTRPLTGTAEPERKPVKVFRSPKDSRR